MPWGRPNLDLSAGYVMAVRLEWLLAWHQYLHIARKVAQEMKGNQKRKHSQINPLQSMLRFNQMSAEITAKALPFEVPEHSDLLDARSVSLSLSLSLSFFLIGCSDRQLRSSHSQRSCRGHS